jgi:hypothetical protein
MDKADPGRAATVATAYTPMNTRRPRIPRELIQSWRAPNFSPTPIFAEIMMIRTTAARRRIGFTGRGFFFWLSKVLSL